MIAPAELHTVVARELNGWPWIDDAGVQHAVPASQAVLMASAVVDVVSSDGGGTVAASYEELVEACPTPTYHEVFRYCPSCPWTERGPLDAPSPPPPSRVVPEAIGSDDGERGPDLGPAISVDGVEVGRFEGWPEVLERDETPLPRIVRSDELGGALRRHPTSRRRR